MALTLTTVSGAMSANATTVKLTSSTSIAKKMLLQVDGEKMLVTDISLAPTVSVARGEQGTLAVAHANLAPAIYGNPSDFTIPGGAVVVSYGADGAISIPTVNTLILVTKATAAALTLAAPAKDQTNTVTIMGSVAVANTVTYTPGFYGDTTSSDVATFAAKVGASMTIQAQSGKWGVVALANVTLA